MTVELRSELNLLQGNINRMCVTCDLAELEESMNWAKDRLNKIYELNKETLKETKRNKNDTSERLKNRHPSEDVIAKIIEYIKDGTKEPPTKEQISLCYQRFIEFYYLGATRIDVILEKEAQRTNYWRNKEKPLCEMLETEHLKEYLMYRDNLDALGMRAPIDKWFDEGGRGSYHYKYLVPNELAEYIKKHSSYIYTLGLSLCVSQHEPVAGYGYYGEQLKTEEGRYYLEFHQSASCD